jgi:hypothetical protein
MRLERYGMATIRTDEFLQELSVLYILCHVCHMIISLPKGYDHVTY